MQNPVNAGNEASANPPLFMLKHQYDIDLGLICVLALLLVVFFHAR